MGEHLRGNGYDVSEEVPVGGGKSIDLVAARDGKRIALEIETGKSDAAANVRKCLDAGMDRVVSVATSRRAKDALARTLPKDPRVLCLTPIEVMSHFRLGARSQ